MTTLLIGAAILLGTLFLWGVISPRGQWNSLVSWTRSEPRRSEPSAAAYAVGRFLSFVGLTVLTIIGVAYAVGSIDFRASERPPIPTLVQRVWGDPRPAVVDRVFTPLTAPPEGLVAVTVDGYQIVHPVEGTPEYLFGAGKIRAAGLATLPGFIGVQPIPNAVALDTADIIVHVLVDKRCIPQQVVLVQSDAAVQVGVFVGQPAAEDGSPVATASECDPAASVDESRGYLIPVDLATALGARSVQTLALDEIPRVPLPR